MSEMLEKARKYEAEQGKQIKAEDRPAFHVSPYVVWIILIKKMVLSLIV